MSEEDKPIEKKKCYNGYNDFFEKMSNITPQQRVGILLIGRQIQMHWLL